MRIFFYCQHVLGIGHLFRTLEICNALDGHELFLVSGGPPIDVVFPDHVQQVRLPGLMMDENFNHLLPVKQGESMERIKHERCRLLRDHFISRRPDLLLVELYPFGRRAFRFELEPLLEEIRRATPPTTHVVCSLRDILVEKKDPQKYESRVVRSLNTTFDALLIHADPNVVRLDETFSRVQDISIPVIYTGFVARKPKPGAGPRMRAALGIGLDEVLVVASAGGGKVGLPILEATVHAFKKLPDGRRRYRLHLFTGPLLAAADFSRLEKEASKTIRIVRFAEDFLSCLAAADLSISMAGYNTCMNILAAGVPSLVWPFPQNREQRLRADRLQQFGVLRVLDTEDLTPVRLVDRMAEVLSEGRRPPPPVDMEGAKQTAARLSELVAGKKGKG